VEKLWGLLLLHVFLLEVVEDGDFLLEMFLGSREAEMIALLSP